jgi:hypothetical protein
MGIENLAMKKTFAMLFVSFFVFRLIADNTVNIYNAGTTTANFEIKTFINGDTADHFDFFTGSLAPGASYSSGGDGDYTGSTYGSAPMTSVHWTAIYSVGGTNYGAGTYDEPAGTGTGTFNVYASGAPPVFTNYTYCAQNNDPTRTMYVVWNFNGAIVQEQVVLPGANACWTTPPIETYPVAQNFNESTVSTFPTLINPTTDQNTNGMITFNAPPPTMSTNSGTGSSGAGNGSGGAGGTQTNTVTAATPPQVAPTNIVTFPTPAGAASESTLNSGFQLLHGDMLNLLTGQKIQNDSINNGTYSITNELGQLVTFEYSNMLVDGQWLPQIYAAITNGPHSGSDTNIFNVSSNVWVQNWPTNNLKQAKTLSALSVYVFPQK